LDSRFERIFLLYFGAVNPSRCIIGCFGVLLGAGDINIELRGVEEFAILCAVK